MVNKVLGGVIGLNKNILNSAKNFDWDAVADQSKQRHHLIVDLFEHSQLEEKTMQELQEGVIATDDRVQGIIQDAKKQAISSSIDLKKTQLALKAYQSNTNFIE